MNFAICTNDADCSAELRRLLGPVPALRVLYYETIPALLAGDIQFDMILLDLDPCTARLAQTLRDTFPGADIILMSSRPELVTDAFSLGAAQFFLKPLDGTRLLRELEQLAARRKTTETILHLSRRGTAYRLPARSIIYIEAYYRQLHIQLADRQLEFTGKLSDVRAQLNPEVFCLCHQGYLVNLHYVIQVGKKELICAPDFHIPVSCRKRREFLHAYTAFIEAEQIPLGSRPRSGVRPECI